MSTNTKKPAQKFAVLISHGQRRWFADNIFDNYDRACGYAAEYLEPARARRLADWRGKFSRSIRAHVST